MMLRGLHDSPVDFYIDWSVRGWPEWMGKSDIESYLFVWGSFNQEKALQFAMDLSDDSGQFGEIVGMARTIYASKHTKEMLDEADRVFTEKQDLIISSGGNAKIGLRAATSLLGAAVFWAKGIRYGAISGDAIFRSSKSKSFPGVIRKTEEDPMPSEDDIMNRYLVKSA